MQKRAAATRHPRQCRTRSLGRWAALTTGLLAAACAAGTGRDAGRADAGAADANVSVDAGAMDAGRADSAVDAGITDAGMDSGLDAAPLADAGTDAGPPIYTLHQLDPDGTAWTVSPADDVFGGALAPRAEDILTAWSLCDFSMICVGTSTRWHCTGDLLTWSSATWSSTVGAAPSFAPPTYTIATRMRSGVGQHLFLSAGSRWWQFSYSSAPTDGAWPIALETHWMDSSVAPPRMDHDAEWGATPNAPRESDRIVADWIDEEPSGDGRWNLVRDDSVRYRYFLSADGTTAVWEPPVVDPRFMLVGAPNLTQTTAMLANCGGTLFAIQSP